MTDPSPDASGTPPSGNLSPVATCCPTVSTFEGSPRPEKVRGFDARTNLAQTRGADEYWIPPDAAKTAPSNRMTQDGAAWVSVMIDDTTEVEVSFEGHTTNACIANSTFDVTPGGIVQVSPTRASASGMALTLRGLAAGEATVKVTCDGEDIGWFHVVCYREIIITTTIGCIKTPLSRSVSYSASALSMMLNRTYNAAGIIIDLLDIGVVDLSGIPAVTAVEEGLRAIVPEPYYSEGFGEVQGTRAFLGSPDGSSLANIGLIARMAIGRSAAVSNRYLWFFVPDDVPSRYNGIVPMLPGESGFVFKDFAGANGGQTIDDSYAVLDHEFGHTLGLLHPDEPTIGNQLPGHLLASLGRPVTAEPGTNTEPPIVPTPRAFDPKNIGKIMQRDPLNLMGYWPNFKEQTFLRKNQWDAARAIAAGL